MRNYSEEDYEVKELNDLNADAWMVEMLKKNPSYNHWGNFEDYMCKDGSGWDSRMNVDTVDEGLWGLDEYNELVNFYFEVKRESKQCECCEGKGLNAETKKLSDDWYSFDKVKWIYTSSNKRYNEFAWQYHLTEIEIEALCKSGRLSDLMDKWYKYDKDSNEWSYKDSETKEWVVCDEPNYPSPEVVNAWALNGFGHDSINQWVAVEARARHLGVYGLCSECNGKGHIFTEDKAKLSLQLWVLHPRKGCSRGVYINEVKENEVEKVITHLKDARDRNNERFGKL